MITILSGSNTFLLQAALQRLVAAFVAEHGDISLERLDGEEVPYDRMREALESLPFLASKKMVVLRAPSANKQFVENAQRLLDALPETTDVIIVEPKLDKRLSYYKYLQKHTDFTEYAELDEHGLGRWLVEEAVGQGAKLASADARYLIERVGVTQQRLSQELAKLIAYDPHITRQTIDLLVEQTPQSTIFELLDAAFSGKAAQALALYDEQRKSNVEPQQIIAMLAWQLHILALVKTAGERDDSGVAREAKLNPFVVRKSRAALRAMSLERLKQLVHDALALDVRLKTSAIDADEATRFFIIKLSRA